MIGDLVARALFALGAYAIVRLHLTQRAAQRRGAHLGPHRRRGRVPCQTCGRLVWTDHAWYAPGVVGPHCSPTCIPDPGDSPCP